MIIKIIILIFLKKNLISSKANLTILKDIVILKPTDEVIYTELFTVSTWPSRCVILCRG